MPQTSYDAAVSDQAQADKIKSDTNDIAGVKWVNVNIEKGTIVVTHGDDYDEAAFKAAAGI